MLDLSRTQALLGEQALQKLRDSAVAVFGVGGVGSFAAEALARCGVGRLILIDSDTVHPSNANRQIIALQSTMGRPKTHVMRERILDINPGAHVETHEIFYGAEAAEQVFAGEMNYVVDAIDSMDAKLSLILECKRRGIGIISSMGTGCKLYPERLRVMDVFDTKYDPIARLLRKRLREQGVGSLDVVCSDERPGLTCVDDEGRRVPSSIAFVPSVCGLIMAGVVVRKLAGVE